MRIIPESFAGVATSTARVIELYYPPEERLFDDRFAYELLPFGWKVFVRLVYLPGLRDQMLAMRERRMPGSLGALLCRTRYIDDVLKQAVADGMDQLVILGAGFDSRPYRFDGLERVRVFEVDLPGTMALKAKRVAKVLGNVPENVTLVGMDFDQQSLAEMLEAAGFRTGQKTFYIWEGVTQYITAAAVDETLTFVSRASGSGSKILFTYVRSGVVDGTDCTEAHRRVAAFAARVGSPWIFGIDPDEMAQFLAGRGFTLISDVGAEDFDDLFLREAGRPMTVMEGERIALAEVNRG